MSLIVQKYGGTSVDGPARIRAVAQHVVKAREEGHDVVVVVSAMGKTTDELIKLAEELSPIPPARELDMLVTAGERISMSLLCIAISELGHTATSFTGSQAGIITDSVHGKAKILEIRADRLRDALAQGQIVVVAGFQGMSPDRNITTLGRGGSDTTAVALAAALEAGCCEIYTDVAGVFSADPRVVPQARMQQELSYEEVLEMAATGGRVLALRSVEFARNYGVTLHVRSAFTWEPGTWVRQEEAMEKAVISAVTHDTSEAKVTMLGVPDRPGIAARLFRALADDAVNVDMIEQNVSVQGLADISFTVPKADLPVATRVSEEIGRQMGASSVTHDPDIARVSLIGAGMKTHPGVAATMFETLAGHGINIEMISTSSIRISCIMREERMVEAVRALHTAFELDTEPVP